MDCKKFNLRIEENLGIPYEKMDAEFIAHITDCSSCREVFEDHECMHNLLCSSKPFLADSFIHEIPAAQAAKSSFGYYLARAAVVLVAFFSVYFLSYQFQNSSSVPDQISSSQTKITPDPHSAPSNQIIPDHTFAEALIDSEIDRTIHESDHMVKNPGGTRVDLPEKMYRSIDLVHAGQDEPVHPESVPSPAPVIVTGIPAPKVETVVDTAPEMTFAIDGTSYPVLKDIQIDTLLKDLKGKDVVFKNVTRKSVFTDRNGVVYFPGKEYRVDVQYLSSQTFQKFPDGEEIIVSLKSDEAVLKWVSETSRANSPTLFNSDYYYRLLSGDLGSEKLIGHVRAKATLVSPGEEYQLQPGQLPGTFPVKPGWNIIVNPHSLPVKLSDLQINYNGKLTFGPESRALVLEYALVLKDSSFRLVSSCILFPNEAALIYSYVEATCTVSAPANEISGPFNAVEVDAEAATIIRVKADDAIEYSSYILHRHKPLFNEPAVPVYPVCFQNGNLITAPSSTGNELAVKNMAQKEALLRIESSNPAHFLIHRDSGLKSSLPGTFKFKASETKVFQLLE